MSVTTDPRSSQDAAPEVCGFPDGHPRWYQGDATEGWFLVRGSNTEPIVRIVAEAKSEDQALEMVAGVYKQVAACIDG